MKRRMFSLAALMLLVLSISVQAAQLRAAGNPSLSFSGTTANCYVNYRSASTSDKVSATLTLYQGMILSILLYTFFSRMFDLRCLM